MSFISHDLLARRFAGLKFNISEMKVVTADGSYLTKAQFKILYGGHTYALDDQNERTTQNAWKAFTRNHAYRPEFIS